MKIKNNVFQKSLTNTANLLLFSLLLVFVNFINRPLAKLNFSSLEFKVVDA